MTHSFFRKAVLFGALALAPVAAQAQQAGSDTATDTMKRAQDEANKKRFTDLFGG